MTRDDEREWVRRHHPLHGAGRPRTTNTLGQPAVRACLTARDAQRLFEHLAPERRPHVPVDMYCQVVVAARSKRAYSLRQVRQVRLAGRFDRAQPHDFMESLVATSKGKRGRPQPVRREHQADPAEVGLA